MGRRAGINRVLNKAAKFAHPRKESKWETLTGRRKVARLCAVFKEYTGEWAWKAISNRLRTPCYLSRGDYGRKIRRKQRTDIGKYAFVNRTIQLWKQLPAFSSGALSFKQSRFRKRIRKVINKAKSYWDGSH
jgi:hypothetical protein